jgi:hypothetical protein
VLFMPGGIVQAGQMLRARLGRLSTATNAGTRQ